METLDQIYQRLCSTESDINEHLPTLKKYSEECEHVTEMGVRAIVSTYALMMGKPRKLISIDIKHPDNETNQVDTLQKAIDIAKNNNIDFNFILGDTLNIEIEETDFLFIDTWHIYSQLKTELELHGNKSRKYLGFHDTTVYENRDENGEGIGLWKAISEFLELNPHWQIHERFYNNNGLTILKRIS
jgi:cephalosporin hydroxylase